MRIRPLIEGFAAETTAGIRGALTDVNAQVAASAKSNAAAAGIEVDANQAVAASYARVGEAAAGQVAGIDTVKAAALEQEAVVASVAKANVAAAAEELDANRALAASYGEIAAAAKINSSEQIAASDLAATAQRRVAAVTGETVAATRVASGGFLGFGRSAHGAERELDRFGRGAIAGSGLASHLGRSLAFASGGFLAFAGLSGLLKSAISDAAGVQKAAEVIRSGFGGASEAVLRFAENASKLGISAGLADQTSARFAILFKNLGIGHSEAAGMTVGFEKLAGSISAIKGVDPTQVLQSIVLAAAGNTRGLKQLGIAIDSTQMKVAAFKLGLTSSITQALTPGQKAQAIYAISTAHLGSFMEQARRHAGDLANVQRRLSAEFANAKEALGTALLPVFTKYATELANWLQRMQKSGKLQADFNSIVHKTKDVVTAVAHAVGTGWKIFSTAAGWIGGTTDAIKILIAALAINKIRQFAGAFIGAMTNMKTAAAETATANAIAAGETATAWDIALVNMRVAVQTFLASTVIGLLVVGLGIAIVEIIKHFDTIKRWLSEFGHWISSHAKALFFVPIIGPFIFLTVEIIKHFGDIKRVVSQFADFFKTVFVHPIRAVGNLFHDLKGDIVRALRGLEKEALKIALAIVEPFSHLPGILGGGPFRKLKAYIQGQLAGLEDPVSKSAKHLGKATASGFLAGVADAVTSAAQAFGAVAKKVAEAKAAAAQAAADKAIAQANAAVAVAHDQVKKVDDAIASLKAAAIQKITDSVRAAKDNLDKIGQDLAKTIDKIQAKINGASNAVAGSGQGQAFAKLKKLIESGAPSFEIARAKNELSSQLQNVGKQSAGTAKSAAASQLANLTASLNQGRIGYREFEDRLHRILREHGVTLKEALKAGGSAFAATFRAEVAALGRQAKAIEDVPARFRRTGGAGGAADIKIIRPLEVIRSENAKIADAAKKQREKQIALAQKQLAVARAIKNTQVGPLPGHDKQRRGRGSRDARRAARAGVRP